MKGKYYYLISGLPKVKLDDSGECFSFFDFMGDAMEQLPEKDARLLNILRLSADNTNLLKLLEKRETAFNKSGNYSEEDLRREIADPGAVPEYMKTIIEAHKSDMPIYYNITWEDQLNWLFYEYTAAMENHFLIEWFSFELNLRNVLSALKCREFNISFERRLTMRLENVCSQAIICHNEITEAIVDSNAPDFSLTAQLPWLQDVLALDTSDLVSFEKGIDLIKWQWLDEMTRFNYFDIEALLAYGIKLQIAERWQSLEAGEGARRFEKLLVGMEGAYPDYKDNMAGTVTGAVR